MQDEKLIPNLVVLQVAGGYLLTSLEGNGLPILGWTTPSLARRGNIGLINKTLMTGIGAGHQ